MEELSLINNFIKFPFILVKNGLVMKVNQKFLDMTEYSTDELIDVKVVDILEKLRFTPGIELDKINEETQYYLFNKSLKLKVVNIQVISARKEKVYIFIEKNHINLDIKLTFAELLFSDNHYGIALYSIPDFVLLDANDRYLSSLDEPYNKRQDSIGKYISVFYKNFGTSSFKKMWDKVIKTGKTLNFDEYRHEGFKRGTTYWKISLIPIFIEEKLMYCVQLASEITEQVLQRIKIEEQARIIEEQNKNLEKILEMKDEFLSFISHEFKTPLNVISSAIQTMDSICGNELPEKAQKYIGMIKTNTLRQLRLVKNLLDITRVDDGKLNIHKKNINIVFLTKAIVDSVQDYALQNGIKIDFSSEFDEKIVGIDDEKYERIILNLLSNAIKFTPKEKSIAVKLLQNKDKICIEVKDLGIGIPEDKLDVIFDKFGQVESSLSKQAEGTGIGLTLVKKFIGALGGSISVKSKLGEGTTFTILLPDETISEEYAEKKIVNFLDNRLIESTKVELSDIYL